MKVWLDIETSSGSDLRSRINNSECHDECDRECDECPFNPSSPPFNLSLLTRNNNTEFLRNKTFQMAAPLYIRVCDEGKWLVCNPISSTCIAVLDQQAITLLEYFHTPTTLLEVIQHMSSCPSITIERVVALFHHLDFLQDIHSSPPVQNHNSPRTLSAWLHITNACNLRCHYCYLSKNSEGMINTTAQRAVDTIFRSAIRHHYQGVQLKYAGGEASLQLTNVLATHDYATQLADQHALKLHAFIMSNGVALSQRIIAQLKIRRIGVMISLDGIGDFHDRQRPFTNGQGSFKYVDRTISRLLANNLMPHINVTVSQRNLDGLIYLVEYILERELSFTLSYYRDNECSTHLQDLNFASEEHVIAVMRDVFAVITRHLPKRRLIGSLIDKANLTIAHQRTCGVGHSYLVIDQHGGVAKCHADIEQTITTIDADDPLQVIRDDRQGVQGITAEDKEGCRVCQWRYWCTGGCPLLTYRITGRSDVKSPNCNIYKALFPEALQLEALRLLKYASPMIF